MSTPKTANAARQKIDEIASLQREVPLDETRASEISSRIEELRNDLRAGQGQFDQITEGLVASTLDRLMPQDTSTMSQGSDPRSRAS